MSADFMFMIYGTHGSFHGAESITLTGCEDRCC
jgi:hypothetical protein